MVGCSEGGQGSGQTFWSWVSPPAVRIELKMRFTASMVDLPAAADCAATEGVLLVAWLEAAGSDVDNSRSEGSLAERLKPSISE